ncbi:hypothetical protein D3C74_456500 [compost metagenome]
MAPDDGAEALLFLDVATRARKENHVLLVAVCDCFFDRKRVDYAAVQIVFDIDLSRGHQQRYSG